MILGNQLTVEDELQKSVEPTRNISEEVATIFSLIRDYRGKRNGELQRSKAGGLQHAANILALVLVLVIHVALVAMKTLPESYWGESEEDIRIALQLIVLFIYLLAFLTFVFHSLAIRKFFGNATDEVIDVTEQAALDEVALFASLDSLSTQSIEYVTKKLERTANQIGSIRSFLLGAIEKVGIIPGLLATLIAMSQIAQGAGQPWIEWLSFVLLGVYIAMFPLASSAFRISNITFVLNQYLKQFRSKGRVVNA